MIWCDTINIYKKKLKKNLCLVDWTTCLKHDNHFKLNSQLNGGGEYMTMQWAMKIVTLTMNRIFNKSSKKKP